MRTDTILLNQLEAYLRGYGMVSEPTPDDPSWEMGRNLGYAYCIDGQGSTLRECIESVKDFVFVEMGMVPAQVQDGCETEGKP